eukprot:10608931-Alexandrium_andersonii.AAC.1
MNNARRDSRDPTQPGESRRNPANPVDGTFPSKQAQSTSDPVGLGGTRRNSTGTLRACVHR